MDLLQSDQVSSMLHELTHLGAIYSPQTADHGYMYKEVLELNTTTALDNAQSYASYAEDLCLARPDQSFPDQPD